MNGAIWQPAEITGLYGRKLIKIEIGTTDDDFVTGFYTFRLTFKEDIYFNHRYQVWGKIKAKYLNCFQVIMNTKAKVKSYV